MISLLDVGFFALSWAYVLLAPYTKVEESFNIQAVHDFLSYGLLPDDLSHFDHFTFSGAVPRTFLGSAVLASTANPFIIIAAYLNLISSKADLQLIVRLVLATCNAISLVVIRKAVSNRFGSGTASCFTLLTCSQFHLLFWMGRTLPNMFAMPLINLAFAYASMYNSSRYSIRLSEKSWKLAFWCLAFSTVVLRVELVLLWVPFLLQALVQGRISFYTIISTNLLAGITAAVASFIFDSFFWQKDVLPELTSFIFNVAQGQSSNWGVSPFLDYFKIHLPKLLMTGLPLAFVGLLTDSRIIPILFPFIIYTALISNLGHKEWRFIIYTVPAFNVAAASGLRYLFTRRKTTIFGPISFITALGFLAANFGLTGLLVHISMHNYPGGEAVAAFHQLVPATTLPPPHVHICNLAAQSGTTLFQHLNSPPYHSALYLWPNSVPPTTPWIYNKTENLTLSELSRSPHFTHIISEQPPTSPEIAGHWNLMKAIPAFDRVVLDKELLTHKRWELPRRIFDLIRIVEKDQLWIYERK
ncbi:hypothetical protein AGABI2DRAFT_184199 [Agaricus bisporus var. bisporus H97]|uniref:hypothetical protein n=1 Tax=Agaricus bisporus var. bisporus (strain H97 / ATCC MYA-4626 / FGSC 10389) TaxID=936046 RepID=UPI00029F5B18|nr:hypothetical protein AGABI2DRAFT_184199 [Agaricus bisporus var. bisporus H97]EKV49465.1 hypothetical protein AGABI2DRAFT_184199 [Agaricus bisporus var. bisporus H97]